jgi:hypothetical protein
MGKGYDRILKIAESLGLPESYKDDLYKHDRRYLGDYDGEFLWSVRPTGTNAQRADDLCDIAKGQGGFGYGKNHGSAWRHIVSRYHSSQERSFHCTPTGCREITGRPEKVREIMDEWMEHCAAARYRISEVLAGMKRGRRSGRGKRM